MREEEVSGLDAWVSAEVTLDISAGMSRSMTAATACLVDGRVAIARRCQVSLADVHAACMAENTLRSERDLAAVLKPSASPAMGKCLAVGGPACMRGRT